MITCKFGDAVDVQLRHVCIHAIIQSRGKLLISKRANTILESGKWSIISGFLNRGETAAEGIIREVKEESGWNCEIVKLFRINSNPFRPNDRDRQNVAIEFILKPLSRTGKPDGESSKIEWVPFNKLKDLDKFAFDHGETIRLYLEYLKKPFPLPLIV